MFEDFLKKCPMTDKIKPSGKRIKRNIAAVNSLIETEESFMTKRKLRFKKIIITAAIAVVSMLSIFTVAYAAAQGDIVKFFLGGKQIDGEFYDYVDNKGFRHVAFNAVLPFYAEDFAVIYNTNAPQGENIRVITDESDPEFMDKLRAYRKSKEEFQAADHGSGELTAPIPEDFGIVLKYGEFCTYRFDGNGVNDKRGAFGGDFMHTGKPTGYTTEIMINEELDEDGNYVFDPETGTKTFRETFYYYAGKEE